jgi:hypothetical protein
VAGAVAPPGLARRPETDSLTCAPLTAYSETQVSEGSRAYDSTKWEQAARRTARVTVRRSLIAADAAGLRTHDHTAWCGDGPREFHELAASVFSAAVTRNELMLFVCEQPRREWLTDLGDVDHLVDRGALQLTSIDDVYTDLAAAADQRARFEALLEQALTNGYSGVCVVADNSPLVTRSDEAFEDWLAWEAVADQLQANRPMSGVCYFDRRRVSSDRLADLAAMHPVRCHRFSEPTFQVFCDADSLRVLGELDGLSTDRIRRVVGTAVSATGLMLDITELEFIDHTTLRTLNQVAEAGAAVRLRGANSVVRRVWELLDLPTPALEFC